jgi:hypothetical protein
MLNHALNRTQRKVDPVTVVLSHNKEKGYDDVKEYPVDLNQQYEVRFPSKEPLEATTQ